MSESDCCREFCRFLSDRISGEFTSGFGLYSFNLDVFEIVLCQTFKFNDLAVFKYITDVTRTSFTDLYGLLNGN